MEQKINCSKCGKEHIKKDGKRKTENRGKIQRYKCLDCSHRFVLDDGFFRMRNNEKKITAGIDLYYKGVSVRKVQDNFKAFYFYLRCCCQHPFTLQSQKTGKIYK